MENKDTHVKKNPPFTPALSLSSDNWGWLSKFQSLVCYKSHQGVVWMLLVVMGDPGRAFLSPESQEGWGSFECTK